MVIVKGPQMFYISSGLRKMATTIAEFSRRRTIYVLGFRFSYLRITNILVIIRNYYIKLQDFVRKPA
jgi:hypothetical protein